MRLTTSLIALACFALPIAAAQALEPSALAGSYGDTAGRLGCGADGEYIIVTDDFMVQIQAGNGRDPQTVAKYEISASGTIVAEMMEPAGHVIELLPAGGKLEIIDYRIGGQTDAAELEAWQSRHGSFVLCE